MSVRAEGGPSRISGVSQAHRGDGADARDLGGEPAPTDRPAQCCRDVDPREGAAALASAEPAGYRDLGDRGPDLRERLLWRLPYESAALAEEVLLLDVAEADG